MQEAHGEAAPAGEDSRESRGRKPACQRRRPKSRPKKPASQATQKAAPRGQTGRSAAPYGGSKAAGSRGARRAGPGARGSPAVAAESLAFTRRSRSTSAASRRCSATTTQGAAGFFRTVLERYPEERELLERARLYLRVCERETAAPADRPKDPAERVYAATVALNSGDHTGALDHLQRALGEDPESDHAHYIMAVALGMRNRADEALEHLRQAIALESGQPGLARQDPDLECAPQSRAASGPRSTRRLPPNRRRPLRRR